MKLFTRYNRIIILIMILIFLLSSIFYYFFLYYILIGEVDRELNYRKGKMERFVRETGKLPVPDNLGDVQVNYVLTDKTFKTSQFSLIKLFDSSEKNIWTFRKLVFTLPVGQQIYQVILVRPLEATKRLSLTIIFGTLSTILVILIS